MSTNRTIRAWQRTILWCVMALFLFGVLSPFHFHLHHDAHHHADTGHPHSVDAHPPGDPGHYDHHGIVLTYESTPNTLSKSLLDSPAKSWLLLALLLLLLPPGFLRTSWRPSTDPPPLSRASYFTPPLRAPPLH